MADILHDFPVRATVEEVFRAFSIPGGLDTWWTLRAEGQPALDSEYRLYFGPGFDWRARVSRIEPLQEFELTMTEASGDWLGTRVGVRFTSRDGVIHVEFRHTGWLSATPHFRTSNCCWASYLRILRRNLEHGESVPYAERLDA